MDQQLLLSLHI